MLLSILEHTVKWTLYKEEHEARVFTEGNTPVGLNRSLPSSSKTEIQKKVMLVWTSKEDSKWPVTMADMYQPMNNKTLQLNMSFFSPTCQSKKWLDQVDVWAVFITTLVSFGRM
jgi:hypothetical protein